jgi:2C-methyl-D-erythritol 2,4-cyclodiphosphate synthase
MEMKLNVNVIFHISTTERDANVIAHALARALSTSLDAGDVATSFNYDDLHTNGARRITGYEIHGAVKVSD